MIEYLFPILIGTIGMLIGIKIGIKYVVNELYTQSRVNSEEREYLTSLEYFWKSFNIFGDDK